MGDATPERRWTLYVCPNCAAKYVDVLDTPARCPCTGPSRTVCDTVEVVRSSWRDRAERAEATIQRMDKATIEALQRADAFTGGVVESIEVLAGRRERAEAVAEKLAEALRRRNEPIEGHFLAVQALTEFDRLSAEEERP